MEFTIADIAKVLGGDVKGDDTLKISKLSKIEEGSVGSISFLANPKYTHYIYDTKSTAVIVGKDFEAEKALETTLIVVDDAYQSFAQLLNYYASLKHQKVGVEDFVKISSSAKLGENVYIGSFTSIGEKVVIGNNVKIYSNVSIGDYSKIEDNTIIFSGVRLYDQTQIGKNCIIHSNTVIGADGFGFVPKADGSLEKIAQIGNVHIEDNVEIGSSCTIDRATMGSTIIKSGAKLDNQIQIAHNVIVGKNTVIASQAGIAGSTKIGENVMIGGQAGLVGHINIGNYVQIQAQSGVNKDVKEGEKLYGSPAISASDYRKSYVFFKQLPQLVNRIEEIEKAKQTKDN